MLADYKSNSTVENNQTWMNSALSGNLDCSLNIFFLLQLFKVLYFEVYIFIQNENIYNYVQIEMKATNKILLKFKENPFNLQMKLTDVINFQKIKHKFVIYNYCNNKI